MRTSALRDVLAEDYAATDARLTVFYAAPDHAVYRVDRANACAWVLRHFPPQRPFERVEADAEVLRLVRHLRVEQLVETRDGRGATRADGRGVIVTEFEEGPPATSSLRVLRQVGSTLGAVHRLRPPTCRADALPREDLSLAQWYLADIADDVPDNRRGAYERLHHDVRVTYDCEGLPSCLVHSDCHLANVIDAERGAVLFDWAGAGQGPALSSLGWLLYSATIQSPEGPAEEFDPKRVDSVLTGYSRHRRLTEAELLRLADAIRFRPLVIATRAFRQSVKTRTPASAIGWWSRYTEAEVVAHQAMRFYENAL